MTSFTVKLALSDYRIPESHVTHLVTEFYGRVLEQTAGAESETHVEAEFQSAEERNAFIATLDGAFLR